MSNEVADVRGKCFDSGMEARFAGIGAGGSRLMVGLGYGAIGIGWARTTGLSA
jgi:hypothetical protein